MAVGRYQHAHAASTYSYILALSRPFSRRRRPRRRRLSFLFTFLPQLSRPFTVILSFSVLFPVLLSLSLFSQPLTPITTFLSVFLTLPISLYTSFSLSLFSYFSHKHRISLRLPLSHFRSSSLVSILIEIAPSPRVVGLAPRDGLLLSSYVIWRDRNYIHRRDSLHAFIPEERKSIDSHHTLSLSPLSPLTSDSFINSLTVILSSSRYLPSIVRFFPSASCIVASRRF